jgi:PAH dioxygenase large subunit
MKMESSNGKAGSIEQLLSTVERSIAKGLVPAAIYSNAEIFELEMERIFSRTWLYLGHESEIPHPGDYVVRNLGAESFILVRGSDGESRALVNVCRHHGTALCNGERGNATSFRCPYHGWTYSNNGELLSPTAAEGYDAYGGTLDKSAWGLLQAPKISRYRGLIFVALSDEAPSLDDYLGISKWYLDILSNKCDGGVEAVGPPQRWVINANWKLPADNFVGDIFHFGNVHLSVGESGLLGQGPAGLPTGANVWTEQGHGVWFSRRGIPEGGDGLSMRSYPDSLRASINRRLSAQQLATLAWSLYYGGNVFPNLGYFDTMLPDLEGALTPCVTLRLWVPLDFAHTEVCSWFMVDRDAPEEFKRRSYHSYMRCFGAAGALEQDDVEVWCRVTRAAKGVLARKMQLNFTLGLGAPGVEQDFPGPGPATISNLERAENNQRNFYRRWLEYLRNET